MKVVPLLSIRLLLLLLLLVSPFAYLPTPGLQGTNVLLVWSKEGHLEVGLAPNQAGVTAASVGLTVGSPILAAALFNVFLGPQGVVADGRAMLEKTLAQGP